MENNNYKAILCDLGNVLCPFSWDSVAGCFAALLNKDRDNIHAALTAGKFRESYAAFSLGTLTPEAFAETIGQVLGAPVPPREAQRILCSIFSADTGMISLMRSLSRDFRTYILSDTDPWHWGYLNGLHGFSGFLSGTILSFERGELKSAPGAFGRILNDYALDPLATVFIDDMPANIHAAAIAGVRGILHTSFESTFDQLKRLGIVNGLSSHCGGLGAR